MANRLVLVAAAILMMPVALSAQTSSAILGRWQAEKHGSPWLMVSVTPEKNSKLGGTAVFYVLDSGSGSTRVVGKQEVQLIDAKLAGNVFSFTVKNQQADVTLNPASGDLLSFEMILKDETHAILKSSNGDVPLVKKE